ncbi:hypothetical protein RCS94_02160 [Orbaceae bacterium ac157xtp]
MIAPSSYGALSATSANTIQGSRPGFTGQSGAKKLGFIVNGTTYSQSLNNINPSVIKEFNARLKLNDFMVTNLTASDFNPQTDYVDSDGDAGYPTATDTFSMNPRTYEWRDRTGALIPTGDYNKTLGCGSNLKLPLTLKITLPKVKVRSRYGNPRESNETNLVQTYKIGTATDICFAKPNSLTWFGSDTERENSGSTIPSTTKGGGYNSAEFDPKNGFKVNLSPKFPTTGFPKASFTLVMTSNASDYTFSSNSSAVTVNTRGEVTLNNKPSGPVTIKARLNGASQVHEYTFDPRTVWVVPKQPNPNHKHGWYTYAEAKRVCGGNESKIPNRTQLTNSPQINHPGLGVSLPKNYYTRAVGGGVFGEWGDASTYYGSQWKRNWYWTRDAYSSSAQFFVLTFEGRVHWYDTDLRAYVVCLG